MRAVRFRILRFVSKTEHRFDRVFPGVVGRAALRFQVVDQCPQGAPCIRKPGGRGMIVPIESTKSVWPLPPREGGPAPMEYFQGRSCQLALACAHG
jgi:hypothetical protein